MPCVVLYGLVRSLFITSFDGPTSECAVRLIDLLDTPDAIPLLYPATVRGTY